MQLKNSTQVTQNDVFIDALNGTLNLSFSCSGCSSFIQTGLVTRSKMSFMSWLVRSRLL